MHETVPRFEAVAAALGRKAIFLIIGEFGQRQLNAQSATHLLHDGSVRLDFMTDDVNEAEEMRIQTVADTLDTFSTTYWGLFSSSLSPSSRAS
jgi:hypothetical protein